MPNDPTTPRPLATIRAEAETRARVTSARAALGDFEREANEFIAGRGDSDAEPDWPSWAWRLAAELRGILAALGSEEK